MRNRITYNGTLKKHFFSSLFYIFSFFIITTASASSEFINVYLKLQANNQISLLTTSFNDFLQEHQLLKSYKVTPFLKKYPLHVTLYLTQYEVQHITKIIQEIKNLAKTVRSPSFTTSHFVADNNAYVMLAIENNYSLQQLSDKVVMLLNPIRDENAIIPEWAKNDPSRNDLFKHYGSPGIFHLYKPHFSILAPKHLDPIRQNALAVQLKTLIKLFTRLHNSKITTTPYALAVGITNNQGQIIKELAAFPLANNKPPSQQ